MASAFEKKHVAVNKDEDAKDRLAAQVGVSCSLHLETTDLPLLELQVRQDPDSLAHLLAAFLSLSAHRGQEADAHTLVHDAIRGSKLPTRAQVGLIQQITKSFNELVRLSCHMFGPMADTSADACVRGACSRRPTLSWRSAVICCLPRCVPLLPRRA